MTNDSFEHALTPVNLTISHGIPTQLDEKVINGREICSFLHMFDEVDLQDIHNKVVLEHTTQIQSHKFGVSIDM